LIQKIILSHYGLIIIPHHREYSFFPKLLVQFLSSKAQAGYRYAVTFTLAPELVSMRDDINLALSDFVKTGSQYLSNIGT